MSEILKVSNLSFAHGEKVVLNPFSCSINQGERVVLLGRSGCGKTTLLRLVAGLEAVQNGEIHLRGELVASAQVHVPPEKRGLGYVFQSGALFDKVSVRKNIYYGCHTDSEKETAAKLIDTLELQSHLDKRPQQLSGGERQKVALARTLAVSPDLVLLDEPLASIDPDQSRFLIETFVNTFAQLGTTVLMVTHSLEEAKQFAQRTIKMI